MTEPVSPAARARRAADLAARPGALRWARDCGWIPGSGYCPERGCSADCVFRTQRLEEAGRVALARRRRRLPAGRPAANRAGPRAPTG